MNRRLILLASFLLFALTSAQSQLFINKNFSKEISVVTDNDRYLLQGEDGYYTNGISFAYHVLSERPGKNLKRISSFALGQKIFNPFSRKIFTADQIDRPVAGYLYGGYTSSAFRHRQLVKWGISVGTIGTSSQAENIQGLFHQMIGINNNKWGWIWNYQVHNEPNINTLGSYAYSLVNPARASWIQVTPVTELSLGTGFTSVSQGLLLQAGKINAMHESAQWNSRLQENAADLSGTELYIYYQPKLGYHLYNATVQGGLFRKVKGPIVSDPEPFVFVQQAGIVYALSRYTLRMEVVFQTREAKSQRFNHAYGSLQAAYRFN